MIFARKFYKIPEFYMIFDGKYQNFTIIIVRKIFFSGILGGGARDTPRKCRLVCCGCDVLVVWI